MASRWVTVRGASVALPSPPTKPGFLFSGWFTAVDGGGEPFTSASPVTRNLTVYARWNAIPSPPVTYTVTYDLQGGAPVAGPVSVTEGASVDLPSAPTKPGFTFFGWFTAAEGGVPFTSASPVTQNLTVYAQWIPNTGSAEIMVIPPEFITVAFSTTPPKSLTRGTNLTISASPSGVVDSYTWYGDGILIPGADTPTVTWGATLARGAHTVTIVVRKGAVLFSNSFTFTVN